MIDYWLDLMQEELACFRNLEEAKAKLRTMDSAGLLHWRELPDREGFTACLVIEDLLGVKTCNELALYLKPSKRGNPRKLLTLVGYLDTIALKEGCEKINVGASIGYRDETMLTLYSKLGYKCVSLMKEL